MSKPTNAYILYISISSGLITFSLVLNYYKGFVRKESAQLKQLKQLKHSVRSKIKI